MYFPNLEEFSRLSQKGNLVPVAKEFFMDTETPIGLFKRLSGSANCFLLESVEGGEKWGRYTFMGCNPFVSVECTNGDIVLRQGSTITKKTGNPMDEIKRMMSEYKGVYVQELPRFCGGAVGYLGYDLVRFSEDLPDIPLDDVNIPDCCLMFYDEVIAYDHLKQRVLVIVNARVKEDVNLAYQEAVSRIEALCEKLIKEPEQMTEASAGTNLHQSRNPVKSSFTKEEFCTAVKKVQDYIYNGDAFQVVISQRLMVENPPDPLDVYRVLRVTNPSPYMYYLEFDSCTVVGSSPELLVRVDHGMVETCPIAGTRPRGKSPEEDLIMERELLEDPKERAEHTMLVDLGRNDLGKVSRFGTVKVENPMHIERYSHVMHIVSNVSGVLREDKDCFDALEAVLPAGTLSGAPKIRAMEIIDEIEPVKRGLYGGAVGYVGFDGSLDTCIAIRTMLFKDNKGYIQAGAGIVADSVHEMEYQETLNKAGALLKALEKAGDIR